MKQRAVFLDRDGVLNHAVVRQGRPHPPASLAEFVTFEDAPEALRSLRAAGYLLIVVTNQPDVARGLQRREVVEAMNDRLRAELPLQEIFVCYHDDRDACGCRKPEPGLIIAAAQRWGIDLEASYLIGDRSKDVEAGRRARCTTFLIERGYPEGDAGTEPDHRVHSLTQAAARILADGKAVGGTR